MLGTHAKLWYKVLMMMLGNEKHSRPISWLRSAGRAPIRSAMRSPITPVKNWQTVIAKVRRVQSHEGGASKGAVRSQIRYLHHKDSHEHDDTLICTVGDPSIIKDWDETQQHYRVIVAPERGDVLDMESLCEQVCGEISDRFGDFEFAGAIHEKLQSNGRLNKHLHLIFRDTMGVGAAALIGPFARAAARQATLQFESRGLHYLPSGIDIEYKREIKKLEHELKRGDYVKQYDR